MEVADEASALEPQPQAAHPEGAETVDAAPPGDPAAPSPAVPAPLDPAPPASAPEPAPEVMAFQPTLFRTAVVGPFWAGMAGAGAALWTGSALQAFSRAHLLDRPGPAPAFFLPLVVGVGVALARGFRAPVRSYAALAGRVIGALFFGSICSTVTVLICAAIFDGFHIRDQAAFATLALAGALLGGLGLARVHGIGTAKPRRIKIVAGLATVLLVSLWPAIPSLRCRLGFGEGCRAAAFSADDTRGAGLLGARGCAHEDPVSCRLAGQAYQSAGPARDLRRAEDFFREGCALGDPASCDGVHAIELEQRCDRYGAFACAELARAHERGEGVPRDREVAQRYYRKACVLGSDDACREAGGR
jgi:hypothetical protein